MAKLVNGITLFFNHKTTHTHNRKKKTLGVLLQLKMNLSLEENSQNKKIDLENLGF